jgi:hypothetical protein
MTIPLPLTVHGPVTPLSPYVRVTGVLPGAVATILDNGNPIGHATAANPGELFVPVTTQPVVGHAITAEQKITGVTSVASLHSVTVVDVPTPLPVPVIVSALNTCMVDIMATALVPGAKVVTTIGGTSFGANIVNQSTSWLAINQTQLIAADAQAQIHQEAVVGGAMLTSDPVKSPNIPLFSIQTDQLPPPVLGPLVQCDTSLQFQHVVPGAGTVITNEGQQEILFNPGEAFNAYGGPPLRHGTAVAVQAMPRCKRTGKSVTIPVAAAAIPGLPMVSQNLCPQVLRLSVSGLAPGGILHVKRRVLLTHGGIADTDLGDRGIHSETETVDLPAGLSLTDPAGFVNILLSQERCAGVSGARAVYGASDAGPFGAPNIVGPLFDCSRGIPITGAHPGALVQGFDAAGTPLSDAVCVTQPNMLLMLWFPLTASAKVHVEQQGCHADGKSPEVTVGALPQTLAQPTIVTPVRPHASWINVTGTLPGARLYLLVNNQLRPGSIDIYSDKGAVPVTGPPLAEKDTVLVVQKLCSKSSNTEGSAATVARGILKVTVSPASAERNRTTMITVNAVDADTGVPVSASVLLNGHQVGVTGTAFPYTPGINDPNPSGIVRDGAAYADANFPITLFDLKWTITMHAGPLPFYIPVMPLMVPFYLTQVTWTLTPDWDTSLHQTVTISPHPPTATATASFHPPTGAVKTVTIAISGTWSTNGGDVNGIPVSAQTGALFADSRKIAFHGPDETIAWLLNIEYSYDPISDSGVFAVIPNFQGISP